MDSLPFFTAEDSFLSYLLELDSVQMRETLYLLGRSVWELQGDLRSPLGELGQQRIYHTDVKTGKSQNL